MRPLHLNLKFAAVAAVVGVICAAAIASSVAEAGSHPAASRKSRTIVIYIRAANVKKVGSVLVNGAGRVLYVFAPDGAKKVTCDLTCQGYWPAVTVPAGAVVKAQGAVEQRLLGTDPNPATHERVVTYNGWPLYTYLGDSAPGEDTGQNIDLSGGYWWVMHPNGKIDR